MSFWGRLAGVAESTSSTSRGSICHAALGGGFDVFDEFVEWDALETVFLLFIFREKILKCPP